MFNWFMSYLALLIVAFIILVKWPQADYDLEPDVVTQEQIIVAHFKGDAEEYNRLVFTKCVNPEWLEFMKLPRRMDPPCTPPLR